MKRNRFCAALALLTAASLCLLLVMMQQYPATLSRLLTGWGQAAPTSVTVTSWPANRENNFTIDDPALLEQFWALIHDVPLVEQPQAPRFYPQKGCYRFSLDGGREVLTDGIYLYTKDRTYTAQTLPALLSLLYRADEKAQLLEGGKGFLPLDDDPLGWYRDLHTEMEAFGLDGVGKFYAVAQREDGLWWCYTANRSEQSQESLLAHRNIRLPRPLGDYRLARISDTDVYLDDTLWQFGMVILLKGDFEPGRIYDWSDKLTLQQIRADYIGPAENPEHHKPICPGLSVTIARTPAEVWVPDPPEAYTEEPPFDGGELCAELAGWQVQKCYSYAMGIQFENGWRFTSPDGCLSARFARLFDVTDPTNIEWDHQAVHRDMTREALAEEGRWLLPLLDVAAAMK